MQASNPVKFVRKEWSSARILFVIVTFRISLMLSNHSETCFKAVGPIYPTKILFTNWRMKRIVKHRKLVTKFKLALKQSLQIVQLYSENRGSALILVELLDASHSWMPLERMRFQQDGEKCPQQFIAANIRCFIKNIQLFFEPTAGLGQIRLSLKVCKIVETYKKIYINKK